MLLVQNDEGKRVFYHHSDGERAKQYGEPKQVYVIMNSSYFVGTWQFEETIDGYIGYYTNEGDAIKSMFGYMAGGL